MIDSVAGARMMGSESPDFDPTNPANFLSVEGSNGEIPHPEDEALKRREHLLHKFHAQFIDLLDSNYPRVRMGII